MPNQFVVPQFIDAEDKIMGPITARQFVILMATFLMVFIFYRLFSFVTFLITGIPLIVAGGIIAFVKINGQAFHFFILNLIQTLKKPKLRVWDKTISTAQLKAYIKKEIPPPLPPRVRKAPMAKSRLKELALIVNTGGVYQPEEE